MPSPKAEHRRRPTALSKPPGKRARSSISRTISSRRASSASISSGWGSAARRCGRSEALFDRLTQHRPGAILLDYWLGAETGADLARAIRSTAGCERLPLLCLTSDIGDRVRLDVPAAGCDEVMSKVQSASQLRSRDLRVARGHPRRWLRSEEHPRAARGAARRRAVPSADFVSFPGDRQHAVRRRRGEPHQREGTTRLPVAGDDHFALGAIAEAEGSGADRHGLHPCGS